MFVVPLWPHSGNMDNSSFSAIRRYATGVCSPFALGVVLAIASPARTARAQSAPDSGPPSHEKRAQVAYALQDWPTAIREFEAAFQSEQKPDYLWGIAQSQRLSGDCKAAINTYKSYRRSEISADQSAAADTRIQRCEEDVQRQAAQAAAITPTPANAASPAVAVAGPATRDVPPQPADQRTPAKPFYGDALGDVLVLTGLASAGVGTYFLLAGNSAMRDSQNSSFSSYESDTKHASRQQVVGVGSLAAGGVLVACGVVRFLTIGGNSSGSGTALTLSPSGVDLRGRF